MDSGCNSTTNPRALARVVPVQKPPLRCVAPAICAPLSLSTGVRPGEPRPLPYHAHAALALGVCLARTKVARVHRRPRRCAGRAGSIWAWMAQTPRRSFRSRRYPRRGGEKLSARRCRAAADIHFVAQRSRRAAASSAGFAGRATGAGGWPRSTNYLVRAGAVILPMAFWNRLRWRSRSLLGGTLGAFLLERAGPARPGLLDA